MEVIRRATTSDLPALLALVREYNEIDRHPHDDVRVERALVPLLDDDTYGQVWLVGAAPAEPVGYAVVTWGYSLESGGRDACLDELYVTAREQGIGGLAIEEVVDATAKAGAVRMFLETEAHNDAARRFYLRHGFAVEDSVWMSREFEPAGILGAPVF